MKTLTFTACLAALAALGSAARADDAEPPAPQPTTHTTSQLDIQLEAGADLHRVYDVPIYGGELLLGIGSEHPDFAVRLTLGAMFGETDTGLRATELRLGATFEGRPNDWFRVGLDLHALYFNLARATTTDDFWALGPGVRPYLAFTLVDWDEGSLYATAGFEAAWLGGDGAGTILWGPSVALGLHF
jgi:hypothetical protein